MSPLTRYTVTAVAGNDGTGSDMGCECDGLGKWEQSCGYAPGTTLITQSRKGKVKDEN